MTVISEMVQFVKKIVSGEENVKPGQTIRITEGCVVNDRVWQGDLAITVAKEQPPVNFRKAEKVVLQLVKGETIGAKHCLESSEGVEQYLPPDSQEYMLIGPWLKLTKANSILHPIHGKVEIPAGFCVQITYQREYDEEQKAARRAKD